MAKLDFAAFQTHLSAFDFPHLFVDVLGWNQAPVSSRAWQDDVAGHYSFSRRMVAELGGIAVLQVVTTESWPDENIRAAIWKHLSQHHAENILIFTDARENATQSQWYWVKRGRDEVTGRPKNVPRRHDYFRGQPVDLFASKLQAMVVELSELDASGRMPVLEAARRIQAALDVEKTTKRFFARYSEQHDKLLEQIEGIPDERDRRWYASVILNRLMFVWFLQKKLFLDGGDTDYLRKKLTESRKRGPDRFFGEFLNALFFDVFAKPEADRSPSSRKLAGTVPYLNGGLFLHHKLELDSDHQPRLGTTLRIPDSAFDGVFDVFAAFSWHLDDTPGGDADEINPDVLGYIFEKYINQKAFGAYYTRPEITGYLAERSIHQLILERIRDIDDLEVNYENVADLLARMDARIALRVLNEVLPSITILDPAVGSGAFLVAALKCLIDVYYAIVGRAELGASSELQSWLRNIQANHPSVGYYIKRRVVTDNLYGVDIMEEASEIAKLRLFLAMVSSVRKVEDLEPLPNIDFNIVAGNSLVGLVRVDEHEFDTANRNYDMFRKSFRELLDEKHSKLVAYRTATDAPVSGVDLRQLRDDIDAAIIEANAVMNELVQNQFAERGIKFEEATWDDNKKRQGKAKKRDVTLSDVRAQHPLHWGYVFDEIVQQRGGFDIILTNPPWEVFKPQAKEFFADHSELVSKNKMSVKDFEKERGQLLENKAVREAWLEYESRFPHMNQYFRQAPEYRHQFAIADGRKVGSDLNLYKLFVERCFTLLRSGGHCGIVVPSGLYTDLGAKGLRDLLFQHTEIQGLFGFENRKEIFEGVHRSFKFVVLTFEKVSVPQQAANEEIGTNYLDGNKAIPPASNTSGSMRFPVAFMRQDVAELSRFPSPDDLWLDVELVRKLSPDSHSLMEFKSKLDVEIAEKILRFPMLGEQIDGAWNCVLGREFHMTDDSKLFQTEPAVDSSVLFEGKMVWQFDSNFSEPRYWVDRHEGRAELRRIAAARLKRALRLALPLDVDSLEDLVDETQIKLDIDSFRLAFRDIASSTNERCMISSMLPPGCFAGNTLNLQQQFEFAASGGNWTQVRTATWVDQLYLCGVLNGFVVDWLLRQKITSHLNMFYVYQVPVPRKSSDTRFNTIVERAAKLICTRPIFDELAQAAGLCDHSDGVNDPAERSRLRAELDGLVAHLYELSEEEFVHILASFPLVAEPVKQAARNAYRDVERGLIQ